MTYSAALFWLMRCKSGTSSTSSAQEPRIFINFIPTSNLKDGNWAGSEIGVVKTAFW